MKSLKKMNMFKLTPTKREYRRGEEKSLNYSHYSAKSQINCKFQLHVSTQRNCRIISQCLENSKYKQALRNLLMILLLSASAIENAVLEDFASTSALSDNQLASHVIEQR